MWSVFEVLLNLLSCPHNAVRILCTCYFVCWYYWCMLWAIFQFEITLTSSSLLISRHISLYNSDICQEMNEKCANQKEMLPATFFYSFHVHSDFMKENLAFRFEIMIRNFWRSQILPLIPVSMLHSFRPVRNVTFKRVILFCQFSTKEFLI